MASDQLVSANQLLQAHALAAVRLTSWDAATAELRLEVFHLDWAQQVFGVLRFSEVRYMQLPVQTSWGYQLRVAAEASLPSRGDIDSSDRIYELFTPDGSEPCAFVVATAMECIPTGEPRPEQRPHAL